VKLKWLDLNKDVCYVADVPDGSVNIGIDWPCPIDGSRVVHVDRQERTYASKPDGGLRVRPWPHLTTVIAADNNHVTVYEGKAPGFRVLVDQLPGVDFWTQRVTSCFLSARVLAATDGGK
jgi:hypothetical protein